MTTALNPKIYCDIEPHFFYDYLSFGNDLRDYVALQISEAAASQTPLGKRLAFISIFKEMMAGFEDTAALLIALKRRYGPDSKCRFQKQHGTTETPIFFTFASYRNLQLTEVITSSSQADLYQEFHFQKLVPTDLINHAFLNPKDARHGLEILAKFLLGDFLPNSTKNKRSEAYNKIKHGGIVMSDSNVLMPGSPKGVAILMEGDEINPVVHLTLPFSEVEIDNMKRMVWLSKVTRKILVVLYLWVEHKQFLASKGVANPGVLFDPDMQNILKAIN